MSKAMVTATGGHRAAQVLGLGAVVWGLLATGVGQAATPAHDSEALQALCALGDADSVGDDEQAAMDHHETRRRAVHQVYETDLGGVDAELFRYEHVSGLLTLSGFRSFEVQAEAPSIRFENECMVSFELPEEQAMDIVAKVAMGTAVVRIGYLPRAHRDFDVDFCPDSAGGQSELAVDLLYAQVVEVGGGDDDEVLASYQTPLGHRRALNESMRIVDATMQRVPEVRVSHLQWRHQDQGWDDAVAPAQQEQWAALSRSAQPHLERAVYPCYVRALADNASVQGALVVEVPVGAGASGRLRFLMDTVDDDELRACVRQRLAEEEALVELAAGDDALAYKATILMRRR